MVKILHTSDVQLDAPFRFLGVKGQRHRQQLRETFRRIVDMAAEADFDLLLITGDLFNDNRPHQDTVNFVVSQLGRLDIPVCILPGNHDCYDDTSVYRKTHFPDNVVIFTEQPTIREFAELDVAVYGNAILSSQSRRSPLRDLFPSGETRWHVAMAHGNVDRPDIDDPSRPIRLEEIRNSGMDYVALGDWHSFRDYSQSEVAAYYSGAPEPTALGQDNAGHVASVEIDDSGVRVSKRRVGAVTTDKLELDVAGRTTAQIVQAIREHADPNLMLHIILNGLTELGTLLDVERLERDLVSDFYYLKCSDHSHPQLEAVSADDYPEELVLGKFVRLMQERIEQTADDCEQRCAEQALQVGIALLEGKEVL